jgi:glycosyltransferase involved in cell wall biosynthesis
LHAKNPFHVLEKAMKLATMVIETIKNEYHSIDDLFSIGKGFFQDADLSIFHKFAPPPSGGGHQFLRALSHECQQRGLTVENNSISHSTRACLFNSFNFDERRLRRMRRSSVLYVHRVDGPIDQYRGTDNGIDRHIWLINQTFADKTIFQSRYSLEKHLTLGMEFSNPVVCMNAADPSIFNSSNRIAFSSDRKVRLIASSWSDNINKGSAVYTWLDQNLDWSRFEFVFVGRSPVKFQNIKIIDPIPSKEMAIQLKQNDIYITASRNDPCSNSLIEALSCGSPALYLRSGGHPEIVKNAGLGFTDPAEIPALLDKIIGDYSYFQGSIELPSIQEVSSHYLKILELI